MGSPNADHEMIIHTDGATLLDAGQDWDVSVGRNLKEYVNGTTDETYQGVHTTQSWSVRNVEIGGVYTQNCHSNVTRNVYADSFTTITGSVADSVSGAVAFNYGPFTMNAPSVTITTPEWTVINPKQTWITQNIDSISGKSFALCGFLNEAFGSHVEYSTFAASFLGLKMESVGVTAESARIKIGETAFNLSQFATSILSCGFCCIG
jgi:hypothetical protein